MPTYKTVLFDWDGTLAQTLTVWLTAYREAFREFKITGLSDSYIAKEIFGAWENPLKAGIVQKDLDKYNERLVELVNMQLNSVALYPGVVECLQKLINNDVKLGIVSTSYRQSINIVLERENIASLFSAIVTTESVSKQKPHPESVYIALEQLQGDRNSTLVVGDNLKDMQLAQNAEVASCLFFPPEHTLYYDRAIMEENSNPTLLVESFYELVEKLVEE
ncbi:MAG: HAD family hydrolase [Candidatus Dojkabacteria bacterium]|nr:MAG: HAD family hydrolase [Candidatus Dojkabacteria bacterium]